MLFTPIKPMLLGMWHEAFDDDRYIFEPKWDGWRILLHKDGERVEAYTRHGNRVTDKFPELQAAGAAIRAYAAGAVPGADGDWQPAARYVQRFFV